MMFKRRDPQSSLERMRQFVWPRAGWPRAAQYLWQRTVRIKGAPHDIAFGLAIGGFISATPFLGTHFILAGLLAYFLGGNLIASMAGTWVGNPLTFPFIWVATYTIGNLFLGTGADVSDVPQLSFALFLEAPLSTLRPVVLPMMLGSIPVGLMLGVATYYPCLWAIEIYQKRRQAILVKKAKARQDARAKQEKEGA